jgi:hypothetical protein
VDVRLAGDTTNEAWSVRKPPIKAWKLASIIAGFWVVFVLLYLVMWEHHPEWQTVLNRISWCSADAVSISATAIALWSYRLYEKSTESKDLQYLSGFVFELRKAGIEPREMGTMLRQVQSTIEPILADADFRDKLEKAILDVVRERYEKMSKLNDEELRELIRSGGL